MRRELLIGVAIGLVAVGALAYFMLWANRGSRVLLEGSVQTVRTQDLDGSCVVVADFRVTNPADYPFMVRKVDLIATLDGKPIEGMVVADVDAKRLFEYYPAIGQKFNDSLKVRERVGARQTADRMVMARFEVPEAKIRQRTGLIVRIEEVDGPVMEIK